jgi:hypothetical protein
MNHQNKPLAHGISAIILLLVGIFYRFCLAGTGTALPLDDPQAAVRAIQAALQNIELVPSGRGTAIMISSYPGQEGESQPTVVDFVFKDQMSRLDRFAWVDGAKGARDWAHIVTNKCQFGINPQYAVISPLFPPLHCDVGKDFHGNVFMHLGGMSAQDALEIMLRPERALSAQVDGNEVIHLVSRWRTTEGKDPRDHAYRLSCDPRIGFLPVSIASEFDFHKRPAESSRQVIKVNWVRHGRAWYVSSADYRLYATGNPLKGTREQVTITEFDPNATISDAEFTLEGLGVTDGMTVIDKLAGVTYQYGAPVKTLEELAEPLEEAEFVEKVADQQGEPPQGIADPNDSQVPAAQTSTDLLWQIRTGLIVAFFLLAAIAAFIGYKRALARGDTRKGAECP